MFTLGPYDLCYQFEQGDQEFKCPPSKKTKNTEFILAFVLFACFFPFSFVFFPATRDQASRGPCTYWSSILPLSCI